MPASSGYFSSFFSSSSENSPVPPPSVQHCLPEAPPPTFFVTDRRLLKHKCEWDPEHIDGPDRLKAIHDELEKNRVLAQCQILEPAECSQEDLRLVHSQEHIDSIREASALPDLEQMEHFCAGREDIYVNSHSWECALLSAGCAIKAMESVVNASRAAAQRIDADQPPPPAPNAFAAIRPPGHHASQNDPCGFCLFNNVAICAKKARTMGLQRVLIVDWDVHAGQGTQYSVEGDTGILLVSIHRYESGQFWPELPESGIMNKYKNTINIPLNEVGYGDAEYAAMMHLLVLPLIQQWKPELILVSCGFDAGLGDPQGEMEVSPAGFGYMTGLLARTGIPLCMVLEGGYFLHSVVKGTLYCMRALLQRAPPMVNFSQRPPAPLFLRTLYTVLLSRTSDDKQLKLPLFRHFTDQLNSLRLGLLGSPDRRKRRELSPIQLPDGHDDYLGNRKPAELAMAAHTYPTRGEYPAREPAVERHFALRLQQLMDQYAKGPPERAPLDIELGPGGRVLIPARHGPENGASKKELIRLDSAEQLLLFYFYLLLPMDFTFFDVSLSSMKLPLTGQQLHGLVARLEKEAPPAAAAMMNGGMDGTTKKCHHWLDLDRILDRFAQMKPFFLFQSSA